MGAFDTYLERKLRELIRGVEVLSSTEVRINGDLTVGSDAHIDGALTVGTDAFAVDVLNNRIGVGTHNPGWTITGTRPSGSGSQRLYMFSYGAPSEIACLRAQGSVGAETDILNGNDLAQFLGYGFSNGSFSGIAGFMAVEASENWSATAQGTSIYWGVTPNGSLATASSNIKMRLSSEGRLAVAGNGSLAVPAVTGELQGTDALLLPKGTTAQRPAGVDGYIRFNTDTTRVEAFYGGIWNNL